MIEDQITLDDGVLWHFFAPKSRHAKRSILPLRQLCVPSILKLDIQKSFHEHGSSHKCAETIFETIRQQYFWFKFCTRIHCCIVSYVEVVCRLRNEHIRIKRHCIALNRVIFLIKFWRIIQDLFDVIV